MDPPRGQVHHVKGNDIFETRGTGGSIVWASRKDGALAGMPELSGVPYHEVYSRIVGATGSCVFVEMYGPGIGAMLWRTDGWVSGTQFLQGLGTLGQTIEKAFVSDGVLYFSLDNGTFWRSDGTPSGTAHIGSGLRVASGSGSLNFTVAYAPTAPLHVRMGDDMFFFANRNGDAGLWASDGTVFGPRKISDLPPGPQFLPTGLGVLGERVLFSGYSENEGHELWVSDGTVAGTQLLVDISPGAQGSHPAHFVNFKNKLYFTALTPDKGRELWVTDGTPAGTTLVKDIAPGIQSSLPGPFVVARGSLYFTAWDPVHGAELWRSDGTPGGTRLVADIQPGMGNSTPIQLTRVGNRLFFVARTDQHGYELYSIGASGGGGGGDGCAAGTNPPGNAALLLLLVAMLATMRAGLERRAATLQHSPLK